MMRTTLNFIEKVEQSEYNNQHQRERPNNNGQQQKERFNDKQNYTYYNNNNSNQNYSSRLNQNPYPTRITNRVQEFNEWMCKIYSEMKKHDCGQRCNREEVKAFNTGKRSWNVNWSPKYND